jgi:hypothetical protein
MQLQLTEYQDVPFTGKVPPIICYKSPNLTLTLPIIWCTSMRVYVRSCTMNFFHKHKTQTQSYQRHSISMLIKELHAGVDNWKYAYHVAILYWTLHYLWKACIGQNVIKGYSCLIVTEGILCWTPYSLVTLPAASSGSPWRPPLGLRTADSSPARPSRPLLSRRQLLKVRHSRWILLSSVSDKRTLRCTTSIPTP